MKDDRNEIIPPSIPGVEIEMRCVSLTIWQPHLSIIRFTKNTTPALGILKCRRGIAS